MILLSPSVTITHAQLLLLYFHIVRNELYVYIATATSTIVVWRQLSKVYWIDFHVWFNTRIGTQVRVFLNTVWRKRKVSQFENLKFSGIFFSDCQILFEKCLLIMSWRLIIFYSYTLNLLDYFLLVRWIFATISKTFSLYEKIALLRDFHDYKGVIKNSAQETRQQRQNNFQKVSRSELVHWLVESF